MLVYELLVKTKWLWSYYKTSSLSNRRFNVKLNDPNPCEKLQEVENYCWGIVSVSVVKGCVIKWVCWMILYYLLTKCTFSLLVHEIVVSERGVLLVTLWSCWLKCLKKKWSLHFISYQYFYSTMRNIGNDPSEVIMKAIDEPSSM